MRALFFCLLVCASPALAGPDVSVRPVAREAAPVTAEQSGALSVQKRDAGTTQATQVDRGVTPQTSLRPEQRTRAIRRLVKQREKLRAKGAVCGNPDLQGEEVGRVSSQVRGCGIPQAVRLRSASGIILSPSALVDCQTALTINEWVTRSAIPRLRDVGGGLYGLRVIGHYSCRTRNNQSGARISEHGKGRAIDIASFRLKDNTSLTVLKDWNSKRGFEPLREMHRDACGIFGTVLGPKSDRFHQDHFHFDTARHRSGSYCR